MYTNNWSLDTVKQLWPGIYASKMKIEDLDEILSSIIHKLFFINNLDEIALEYFRDNLSVKEIADTHGMREETINTNIAFIVKYLKNSGYAKSIISIGYDKLVSDISYNTTRYHIGYLPIPANLISKLDMKYGYTMISDLIDMVKYNEIPRMPYNGLIEECLIEFNLIDPLPVAINLQYPYNLYKRLYGIQKEDMPEHLPNNFAKNFEICCKRILDEDVCRVILMKYKLNKTYKEIADKFGFIEKDVHIIVENAIDRLRQTAAAYIINGHLPNEDDFDRFNYGKFIIKDISYSDDNIHSDSERSIDNRYISDTLNLPKSIIARLNSYKIITIKDIKRQSRQSLLSIGGIGNVSLEMIIRELNKLNIFIPKCSKTAIPFDPPIKKQKRQKSNNMVKLKWPNNFIHDICKSDENHSHSNDDIECILNSLTDIERRCIELYYKQSKTLQEIDFVLNYTIRASEIISQALKGIRNNNIIMNILKSSAKKLRLDIINHPSDYTIENTALWGLRAICINKYINIDRLGNMYNLCKALNIIDINDLGRLKAKDLREKNAHLIAEYGIYLDFLYRNTDLPSDISGEENIIWRALSPAIPVDENAKIGIDMAIAYFQSKPPIVKFISYLRTGHLASIEYIMANISYIREIFNKFDAFLIEGVAEQDMRIYSDLSILSTDSADTEIFKKLNKHGFDTVRSLLDSNGSIKDLCPSYMQKRIRFLVNEFGYLMY